jgi:glycosyltransferase involved in cell wall biosynthesis
MRIERRVAFLTSNIISDRYVLFKVLQPLIADLRIYLSGRAEMDDPRLRSLHDLPVYRQRSIRVRRAVVHSGGFADYVENHFPFDTLFRLLAYKPHIVLSGELGVRTLLSVIYRWIFRRTTLIVWATCSERTEATRHPLRTVIRRWMLKHVDAAYVNGSSGERYLRGLGFRGRIFVVPYSIDSGLFARGSAVLDDGRMYLFCACRLVEGKGLYPFLVVLAKWCSDHLSQRVNLRIAGYGPELTRLQSVVAPPNLEIEYLGKVPHEQIADRYHAASIFVFPTLVDEWGLVVPEALSAGLPVLGSIFSPSVEELIVEGENGWKFDPLDRGSTYDAIGRALLADRKTLEEMSRRAVSSVAILAPDVLAQRIVDSIHALHESSPAA